jgi:hypothetical protein
MIFNRVRRLHLLIVAVILMVGIAAAFFMVLVKPRKARIAVLEKSIASEKQEADQEATAQATLEAARSARSEAVSKWNMIKRTKMSQISLVDPYTAIFKIFKETPTYGPQMTAAFAKDKRIILRSNFSFPQRVGFKPPDTTLKGFDYTQNLAFTAKSFPDLLSWLTTTGSLPRVMALGGNLSLKKTPNGIDVSIPAVVTILYAEQKTAALPTPAAPSGNARRPAGVSPLPGRAPQTPGGGGRPGMGGPGPGPMGLRK